MNILFLIGGLGLALLIAALVAWLNHRAGLKRLAIQPNWQLLYADDAGKKAKLLAAETEDAHIVGRPDRVYKDVKKNEAIIVEDKSRKKPRFLYDSHKMQLAAYVMMVEQKFDLPVSRALVRYSDGTIEVPVNDELREEVIEIISEMAHVVPEELFVNHNQPAKCRRCEYRNVCPQAMWTD